MVPTGRTIWITDHDRRTHWATVEGDEDIGYTIRSDCGLSTNAYWAVHGHDLCEITCPACLAAGGPNQALLDHLARAGGGTAAPPAADPTEAARRTRLFEINVEPKTRTQLEAEYGQVWTTQELARDFEVKGFMAPLVVARRRADGVVGSLECQNSPRFYFSFQADTKPA